MKVKDILSKPTLDVPALAKKHDPSRNVVEQQSSENATYRPLKNDGALFKCGECGDRDTYDTMFYISLPNGHKGVYHKKCLDQDWISQAEFINSPI